MLFEEGIDTALVSGDGDHLALNALGVFFEPSSHVGTRAIFSRGATGWAMRSLVGTGMERESFTPELLSPDFSQVAFLAFNGLHNEANRTLYAGTVGGPYSTIASVPRSIEEPPGEEVEISAKFVGSNAGVAGSVPAFEDILIESNDHALLPPGPERQAAEETVAGRPILYDFHDGHLLLLNVDGAGELLNQCGAILGSGSLGGDAIGAVSADGSRVFFESPAEPKEPSCVEPALYMRTGGETVDVSEPEEPEGVSLAPSERGRVRFDGASADGSKVFFTSESALTSGAGSGPYLYEFDVEAPAKHGLTLIANRVAPTLGQYTNPSVVVSEDGSAVYYVGTGTVEVKNNEQVSVTGFWRYDTSTRISSFVAITSPSHYAPPPQSYVTPDGNFLVFTSGSSGVQILGPGGLEVEPRGVGQQQLYLYDALNGSVLCVSCGDGTAPAKGFMEEPETAHGGGGGLLSVGGGLGAPVSVSDDGGRVFFQSSAQLVPQDTNEDTLQEEKAGLGRASDVYEWEALGEEEAPGVVCGKLYGCTHLISAGEAVGPSRFLGASQSGRDVFFTSAAQLVPQAVPGVTAIYDARIGGGFPEPSPPPPCTSCQGLGRAALSLVTPASETLEESGNPAGPVIVREGSKPTPKPKPKARCRRKSKHGRCVRASSGGHRSSR